MKSFKLNCLIKAFTYLGCFFHEIARDAFAHGHRGALPEELSNFWVHLDCQVLDFGDFVISHVDSLINPLLERGTQDCINHIGNVLSWELINFLFRFRQMIECFSIPGGASKGQDIFNWQSFEVGNVDEFDIITFDDFAFVGYQVPEMEDGDCMIW